MEEVLARVPLESQLERALDQKKREHGLDFGAVWLGLHGFELRNAPRASSRTSRAPLPGSAGGLLGPGRLTPFWGWTARASTPPTTSFIWDQVELATFQPAPILAISQGAVVVGTEREPGQLACPCTLKLWEASGSRVVTLGNINFPEGPKPGG